MGGGDGEREGEGGISSEGDGGRRWGEGGGMREGGGGGNGDCDGGRRLLDGSEEVT